MECKEDGLPVQILMRNSRINRNIVECKDRHMHSLHRWSRGINRNIVECKVLNLLYVSKAFAVLIET